ncbi:hypothetical protein NQT62_03940 [Limnobacter humi]|uniref:MBL fold metallo-hydrolase n=1 Tax=Limnobacter humi TaxID=1778671 RepID=A0ABT1WDJ9_9BURK|nr:hypothetical protein [Limnobacter humi]MCQ8895593.1 hypothetical protein [Limnobacter humi]
MLKKFLLTLLVLLAVLGGFIAVQANRYPPLPEVDNDTAVLQPVGPAPSQGIAALFLGTSSFLWTDGKTQWLLDGFFSRPSLLEVMFSRLDVNKDRVNSTLGRAFTVLGTPAEFSAVFVAHSHYDHALDAPYLVKQQPASRLYGSASTRQIALGQQVPAHQISLLNIPQSIPVGDFTIRVLGSAHAPTGFTGGNNDEPLRLPAHALAFKEGMSYSFVVYHQRTGAQPLALIQPSAGYVPGQNAGLTVPVVFLGTGGLGKLDEEHAARYWQEMVKDTGAKTVYLIHWDDFTLPLMKGGALQTLRPMPELVDHLDRTITRLQAFARRDGVSLTVLQAWKKVNF